MLACVSCLAFGANLSNFEALIAPAKQINGHLSIRQGARRSMRCWQSLDLNVFFLNIQTGEFSNTDEVRYELFCIYHISFHRTTGISGAAMPRPPGCPCYAVLLFSWVKSALFQKRQYFNYISHADSSIFRGKGEVPYCRCLIQLPNPCPPLR